MPPNTPEPLDGELRFDEATRNGRADDFGHLVHKMPEGVLLSGSADDVAKTIQWTAQRGGKFAPQGQCHSTFGRSQVPGGATTAAASGGGLAFRLDVAKNVNGDPPDDNVLLAGLSDDPAQRQPTRPGPVRPGRASARPSVSWTPRNSSTTRTKSSRPATRFSS